MKCICIPKKLLLQCQTDALELEDSVHGKKFELTTNKF